MTTAHLPGQSVTPMKARSLSDLVHLVPSLVGFHPTESMVVVLIEGGQVVVTARIDLAALTTPTDAAGSFGALWERFPGATCCAVAYSADDSAAWVALDRLEASLPPEAVFAVARVEGGFWFASPNDVGLPYDPASSALAAEAAYRGIRVLPNRTELEATLDGEWPESVLDEAMEAVIALPPGETITRALTLLAQLMRSPRVVSPFEATLLGVAAYSPSFTDVAVFDLRHDAADAARQVWTSVVRATTQEAGAYAAVLLGLASWIGGDGALVNVVLGRAEPFVSERFWFQFLSSVMCSALPPDQWEGVRREVLAAR